MLHNPSWPTGFHATRVLRAAPAELRQVSVRLQGRLVSLRSFVLSAPAVGARVNIAEAADETQARQILHRTPAAQQSRFARRGRFVVEFVQLAPGPRHRLKHAWGLLDRSLRRYRITARLALVDRGDAGVINRLFDHLARPQPSDPTWREAVRRQRSRLTFGRTLALRSAVTSGGRSRYRLAPAPRSERRDDLRTVYTFGHVPRLYEIPYVDLVSEVSTAGFTSIASPVPAAQLTAATRRWPAMHRRLQAIVARIAPSRLTPGERLKKVHGWVRRHLRHGGPQVGARGSTIDTLRRGQGRCWELSDVFVTLARAARLPTRQVAGWVAYRGAHVWAEVYLPGTGWIGVDTTQPWLGVSGGYIPLMTTATGELTVFFLRRATVERLQ